LGAQRGLNRGLVPPKSEFDALKASLRWESTERTVLRHHRSASGERPPKRG
jgi:hypothetical protein